MRIFAGLPFFDEKTGENGKMRSRMLKGKHLRAQLY